MIKLESNKQIWVTSDWHIGHKNILRYDNRPFFNIEAMNQKIIENFNSVVKDNDDVYYLGDFAFNIEQGIEILKRVKGRWHFIIGNHDRALPQIIRETSRRIEWVDKIREVKMNGQEVTLCHFPMISWNKSHYGTWHLFGHHHQKTYEEIPGRRLNVTINLHDYKPWSYKEIKDYMEMRDVDLGRDK